MAKGKRGIFAKGETTEGQTEGEAPATEKANRSIMLDVNGEQIARTAYIRKRFTEDKVSRSEITKEVSKLQGKAVPYQIIFAATKGLQGGPDKVEAAAENNAA